MTRLTHEKREDIADAAIADRFEPEEKALKAQEHALAKEALAHIYDPEELKAAKKLSPGWVAYVTKINVIAEGMQFSLEVEKIVPSKGGPRPAIKDEDLARRIVAHAEAKDALRRQIRSAREKLAPLLRLSPSVKRLARDWPEGKAYYEKFLTESAPVPALPVQDINAALGLPK